MATLNEEIGKLIARRLLADEAVTLPEVGALYTKRVPAKRISSTQLVPPHRVIAFSDTPMGRSLVEEIMREARCTEEQAADAYARWRSKSSLEGRLNIEGVGSLCLKSLSPTEEFEKRLNPQGRGPIRVKRRPMPWWIWTAITLGTIALLFGLLARFVNPVELWQQWSRPKATVEQQEPTALPESAPEVKETTATPESTGTPQVTEPAGQEGAESEQNREERPEEITRTRSGMSYVVMGIYSTESNARRAVKEAVKRHAIPEADFRLFRYGEKWLVSLGEVEKRAEAQQIARRYRTQYGTKEVWVYSKP